MMKTKFFEEETKGELEEKVNRFIQNKNVINVSYTVARGVYGYIHCCCVLYRV